MNNFALYKQAFQPETTYDVCPQNFYLEVPVHIFHEWWRVPTFSIKLHFASWLWALLIFYENKIFLKKASFFGPQLTRFWWLCYSSTWLLLWALQTKWCALKMFLKKNCVFLKWKEKLEFIWHHHVHPSKICVNMKAHNQVTALS